MRSLSEQTSAELGGPVSVLTRQKSDHVKLNGLLAELDATPPAAQDGVLRRIYRLVFPHAFAEESVLWPAIRRVLPEGEQLTLQIEQEHQEVNELVTALEQRPVDDPERSRILSRLVQVLREDVRDEEDELLPRLQAALTVGQLRSLGVAWEVVRRTAPTRAHPVVARRPPGHLAAAVPRSVLDRLRDLVDSAYQQGPTEGGSALRTASTGLTALAHRVEQLPIMKKGEDPTTHRG